MCLAHFKADNGVGLSPSSASALLAERAADLPPDVRDRLIDEATGNPLALIELSAALRGGQPPRVGAAAVTEGLSVGGRRVPDAFGTQVDGLTPDTRLALLVAAAEDIGQVNVVLAAAARLGLALSDPDFSARFVMILFCGRVGGGCAVGMR